MAKPKEFDYDTFNVVMIIIGLSIFFGFMIYFVVSMNEDYTIQDVCLSCNDIYGNGNDYTVDEIDILIDKISNDCGSTHIFKDGEDWKVFKRTEIDGWSKYENIKLSDCLNQN